MLLIHNYQNNIVFIFRVRSCQGEMLKVRYVYADPGQAWQELFMVIIKDLWTHIIQHIQVWKYSFV